MSAHPPFLCVPGTFVTPFSDPVFLNLIKKVLFYKNRVDSIDVLGLRKEFVNNDDRVTTFGAVSKVRSCYFCFLNSSSQFITHDEFLYGVKYREPD